MDTNQASIKKHYDLIVIGSGAGTKLVRPVASLGKKVAIIERESLGGTCLNKGCIPSKMLLHPAEILHQIADAHRFHIQASTPQINANSLLKEVFSTIDAESESIEPLYSSDPNIDLYRATARFVGEKVIDVNGELISADKVVIATGALPHIPKIPGLKKTPYWTYQEVMRLKELPKSLTVLGTGFIGVELGFFFAQMGVEVTFLARSHLLSKEDADIRQCFTEKFCKTHHVHFDTEVLSVDFDQAKSQFNIQVSGNNQQVECLHSDALLVATGIKANVESLAVDRSGIGLDAATGFITVDQYLQTSCKDVYAIGDCTGKYFFRHSANFEGQWLFESLFGSHKARSPITYPPMPHAVFSSPQIASVGPTEEELKRDQIEYICVKQKYCNSAMGMALKSEGDFIKLLCSPSTQKILAVHIIGHEAANLLHIPLSFMHLGATVQELADMVYVHPALAEVVRNAARKTISMIQEGKQ